MGQAMRVGDVPRFVVSVAVEGVLPKTFGVGGDEGNGWLRGALEKAFRREEGGAADGGSGGLLPAQVRVCALVEHAVVPSLSERWF